MGSLELHHETTSTGAAVSASYRTSHLVARVSALVALLILSVALGAAVSRPFNVAAAASLGLLASVLLSRFWLERVSVQAVIDNDHIAVLWRMGTRVRSEQQIPRVHGGRFTVTEQPSFLSVNIGDRRNLSFGEHVIQLPFVLSSLGRASQISTAWNQLLAEQSPHSA